MIKSLSSYFAFLTCCVHFCYSTPIDTNFIAFYPYQGTFYSYWINKNNRIEYFNKEKNYRLQYIPNSWGSWGIGATYRWIDLSVGIASYGKKDESLFGKTNKIDIQSHLYPRNYLIDLFFQYYQGFYSESHYITNDSNTVYIRPDVAMAQIGGSLFRVLKPDKFSAKSVFSASEIQKKSAGTWVLGGKFNVFFLGADSSLTSKLLDSIFKSDFRITKFNTLLVGLQGGYLYNWKRKNWILHFGFIFGLATQLQYKEIISMPGKLYPHSTTGGAVNVRLAATYSKNRFFFILAGITDFYQYPLNNYISLEHMFGRVDIIGGYRLFTKKTTRQVLNL
ncbi:MAG: DUF4421 domain-containing protein [Bacteroidales bacterium]|nr:DUF4421 domain-containing protein [Bacteroidales bacterium]